MCMEVTEVVNSVRVVLSQWKEIHDKIFDRSWALLNPNDGAELWTPPTENRTKINTDATVYDFLIGTPMCLLQEIRRVN